MQHLDHKTVAAVTYGTAPPNRSATGYGNKIPTPYSIRGRDGRTRRVYAICHSNVSTLYVLQRGRRLILDLDTEHACELAREAPGGRIERATGVTHSAAYRAEFDRLNGPGAAARFFAAI